MFNVLVNRITCNIRGEVTIQYNFSDPLLYVKNNTRDVGGFINILE